MFEFLKNFRENINLQQELKCAQLDLDRAEMKKCLYKGAVKELEERIDRLQSQVDFHMERVKELEQKNKIYEELILKFNLREKGHEID
jgi:cupin superfamily acireductone dioxygenase involved in methionine salvage